VATSYLTPGVYVEEVPARSGTLSAGATAVAAFVGFTEKYPSDPTDPDGLKPRLVTSWSDYESKYGGFVQGAMLPYSVYGYFNNGGSVAYIVRIPNRGKSEEPGTVAMRSLDASAGSILEFATKEAGANVDIVIDNDEDPKPPSGAAGGKKGAEPPPPEPTFTLTVNVDGKKVKSYEGVTLTEGAQNVKAVLEADAECPITVTKLDTSKVLPELARIPNGVYAATHTPGPVALPDYKAFEGSESRRAGIGGLALAEDVTMVMVPDLITACRQESGETNLNLWKAVQIALVNHCENHGNRMAVLDAPPGFDPQAMREWRQSAGYSSPFAALYYPWIKVANPIGSNGDAEILVPPSGHLAGVWARNDDTRGVWKAPANEVVRAALDVERQITKAEQGLLNPEGINCIRSFGSRGIRVWGARTLADPTGEWVYVNVRRLFNMIESTILDGTQFAVFEPNDVKLWEGLKRTVGSFLLGLWRDGALFGATAEQAFYVKCDEETNPPESIDQGKVVVEVGIAPVKPAEFVIFRISQIKQSSS